MTKYEHMEHDFLLTLRKCGPAGYGITLAIMARQYGIEPSFVREQLVAWAEGGLIWLGAWADGDFRSFETWENVNAFFDYASAPTNNIQVKLLAEGDKELERLDEIKHRPIGF